MDFRDRLRLAATRAGVKFSQTEIAKALGTSKQTVDAWFRGGEPKPSTIYHIADLWRVDPKWLATGDGDMVPKTTFLTTDEREVLQAYRKVSPQKRAMIEVVLRALGKAMLVVSLGLPTTPSSEASAFFDISTSRITHWLRLMFGWRGVFHVPDTA